MSSRDVLQTLDIMSRWSDVEITQRRDGAYQVLFFDGDVGHLHRDGSLHCRFSPRIRLILVSERHAQPHELLPNSGWVSMNVHNAHGIVAATWLLRLSILRRRVIIRGRGWSDQEIVDELIAMDVTGKLWHALTHRKPPQQQSSQP